MSGHSKWSKVKHKKATTDAQKSNVFSKFARVIALESKKATGNVDSPGLRAVIERARGINMPSSNIERAVKKGLEKEASKLEEMIYEAYGPGGSALVIHALTDSRNRASAEIRHALSLYGATLAEQGAASWAFEKNGDAWTPKVTVPLGKDDGDKLQYLIQKLEEHDDVQAVYTNVQ